MPDSLEALLRKAIALGVAIMIVTTISAIAVVRADHRNESLTASGGGGGGGGNGSQAAGPSGGGSGGGADGGAAVPGDTSGSAAGGDTASSVAGGQQGVSSPGSAGGTASSASPSPRAASSGGGAQQVAPGAATGPSSGTDCPDYNPNIGMYCDYFKIGGTTVLSGPLAVYGDQGLKAGQAWLTYFNTEVAPKEGLRKVKLIWYDDNLDPNKTLQYTQRLNEVDKVFFISGVTSPEAISPYVTSAPCRGRAGHDDCPLPGNKGLPFIGDFGLSPKSYKNPMIFPVIPSPVTTIGLLVKESMDLKPKTMSVIWGTLPGVDNTEYRQGFEKAAADNGVKLLSYREMANTDSDCSAQFSASIQGKPEFIFMPVATSAMLACLRAAKTNAIKPGSPTSPWLKGWFGGSGLQVEVDNCKPTCEGMRAATPFRDPRTNSNPQVQIYRRNMARYAPSIDYTGFIAVNYYHTGWVVMNLLKQAGITNNLTRKTIVDAANKFGPFDTGFGDTITWRPQLPREPTHCGYRLIVKGDQWVYDENQTCL